VFHTHRSSIAALSALCRTCGRPLGNRGSIALRTAQPVRLPIQLGVFLIELFDLQKLVFLDVREVLPRVAGRPPDFQVNDARVFAQADVLL
jgi:hypothetical protein